jgi:hypothetical protein
MMEFVNGKDDIPYMKWKNKEMFETTNQQFIETFSNIELGKTEKKTHPNHPKSINCYVSTTTSPSDPIRIHASSQSGVISCSIFEIRSRNSSSSPLAEGVWVGVSGTGTKPGHSGP